MKVAETLGATGLVALVLIALGATGCAQANQPAPRTAMSPPAMKMTTEIPASVTTPAEVETRLGTLRFVDGVPTEETAEKIWDNQDFSRAVESMIMTTPTASLQGFRRGIQKWGPDNETMARVSAELASRGSIKILTMTAIPIDDFIAGFG